MRVPRLAALAIALAVGACATFGEDPAPRAADVDAGSDGSVVEAPPPSDVPDDGGGDPGDGHSETSTPSCSTFEDTFAGVIASAWSSFTAGQGTVDLAPTGHLLANSVRFRAQ